MSWYEGDGSPVVSSTALRHFSSIPLYSLGTIDVPGKCALAAARHRLLCPFLSGRRTLLTSVPAGVPTASRWLASLPADAAARLHHAG